MCIYATREGDYVLFHHEGGVDVGDVDAKAQRLLVGVDEKLNAEDIKRHLLVHAPEDKKELSFEKDSVGTNGDKKSSVTQETSALGSGYRREKAEWASLLGSGWRALLCPEEGATCAWGGCWLASSLQDAGLIPHLLAPVCLVPCLALSLTASFRLRV